MLGKDEWIDREKAESDNELGYCIELEDFDENPVTIGWCSSCIDINLIFSTLFFSQRQVQTWER